MEKNNNTLLVRNTVSAFTRKELNEILSDRLGMPIQATDEQWERVVAYIHSDDEAWAYMMHTVDEAVSEVVDPLIDSLK